MAGDWIKMRKDLRDDPAVIYISGRTDIDADGVVGKLHRLWSWADSHTSDGNVPGVTGSWIDVTLSCAGFAQAMSEAGWIKLLDDGVVFPKYDEHNSESAKRRGLTAKRVRNHRSVTKALPEKRREEKSKEIPKGISKSRPSIEEVTAYCAERGKGVDPQAWFDHYESNGWRVGRNPMKDWRACVRQWERSEIASRKAPVVARCLTDEEIRNYVPGPELHG